MFGYWKPPRKQRQSSTHVPSDFETMIGIGTMPEKNQRECYRRCIGEDPFYRAPGLLPMDLLYWSQIWIRTTNPYLARRLELKVVIFNLSFITIPPPRSLRHGSQEVFELIRPLRNDISYKSTIMKEIRVDHIRSQGDGWRIEPQICVWGTSKYSRKEMKECLDVLGESDHAFRVTGLMARR